MPESVQSPKDPIRTERLQNLKIFDPLSKTLSEIAAWNVPTRAPIANTAIKMAGSIKLFSYNRKYCHVVGIYRLESNQNGSSINSRNWMYIISFLLYSLSSMAFLLFEKKSMLEYGISFLGTSTAIFFMCMYVAMIWRMKNTWPLIEACERFIEQRDNSITAYRELMKKIDRLCEFVAIAMIATFLIMTVPFLLYSYVNYYILELGEESFLLFYPATWPFDWKTPLGYSVAWLVQFAGLVACCISAAMILNIFFGPCWLFIVMAKDITKDLAAFNKDVEANANREEWMNRFCDIIQLYSDAKQCVNQFNGIMKYSLFLLVFYLTISVTSMLLTLQYQLMDANAKLFETLVICILALWIFGILFFICEIGVRVTFQFEMFREEVELCDWHMLPIKMQRMYLIFLSDAQQPKHITCYGNILLTRETFKEVLHTGWSYFMTIRQLET